MSLRQRVRGFVERHIVADDPDEPKLIIPCPTMGRYVPMTRCIIIDQWIIDPPHDGMSAASTHAHSMACHWGDPAVVVDLETGDVTEVCGPVNERAAAEALRVARLAAQVAEAFV